MLTFSVQSGSCGNCIYYQSRDVKLLFDAGISFKILNERLTKNGVNWKEINGLFISHEHSDHSRGIGVFQRKMNMPVFISPKTFLAVESRISPINEDKIEHFIPNDIIDIQHIKITTIRTPHDGIEPAVFVVDDGKTKIGIFTDLGYCFDELINAVSDLDLIYIESNYDLDMLRENPAYPYYLKQRIVGNGGHISNVEGANLIKDYTNDKLKYIFLSHLSANNNTPELAFETHNNTYKNQNKFKVFIAPRNTFSNQVIL